MRIESSFASISLALAAAAASQAANPAITIYNQNFAVVRDTVPLALQAGVNTVAFSGATAKLEPDSVILRDPAGQTELQILEQNYRNDPVSEQMLLSFFEGRSIDFVRREPQKADQTISGKVVRSGYVPGGQSAQPIVEVDGKLQFSLPGSPNFPSLGDDNILKPALSWKLNAPAPTKLDAELAYVTGGFTWQASYNLIAPEHGDSIDFVGWITMQNDSGMAFQNARIKLMAGDVNKVQPQERQAGIFGSMRSRSDLTKAVVTEKTFDEFHLYTLAHPATLRDKETKQVEFVRAADVKAARLYVYDGASLGGWRSGMQMGSDAGYGTQSNKKVSVFREFKNTLENHLGIPLPKGRVRFYSQDEDRQVEFVGENNIEHTPKDELVRLYVGDSFDLIGDRKRTDFKVNEDNHWSEEAFEVHVRNHKKEPVEIRVLEHLYRWNNWAIKANSQQFEKLDAQTIEFKVPLKPDEDRTVTYRVHYSW